MVDAVKRNFSEIYSIELSETLAERATELFSAYDHIHIVCGDSSEKLPEILSRIVTPCLFWLDGHYSGGITARGEIDYPVINELDHVRRHFRTECVILIDDARLFTGEEGIPSIELIERKLREINPDYQIELKDDIIRAYVR